MSLRHRWLRLCLTAGALFALAACASHPQWQLDDVQGHLPDLKFQLTGDLGQPVTAAKIEPIRGDRARTAGTRPD
jgi:protein SCO1/2